VLRAELPDAAQGIALSELSDTLLGALRFTPYPDVRDCLIALRARDLRLVIVSNWDISLHQLLIDTGLSELLDGTVTSAEMGCAKPRPAIFKAALALARASPDRALHVGDSVIDDVTGARSVGIEAVLLSRGGVAPTPGIRSISSLTELPSLVDGLGA
jgi:putative hydrolase of the HAD superfamily